MRTTIMWAAVFVSGCSLLVDPRASYEYDLRDGGQAPRDGGTRDGGRERDAGPHTGPADGGRDAALPDGGSDGGVDGGPCGTVCEDPNPICDPSTGACVACLADADCDDADPCTLDRCGIDQMCSSTADATCVGQITAGGFHTCVRRLSGQVLCWGYDGNGQLGSGASVSSSTVPVVVAFFSDAHHVSAGFDYACASRSSGAARCWGANTYGELGDGTTESRTTPVSVTGLSDSTQISAGWGLHTCARRATGEVACWGFNGIGQLGNDDPGTSALVPAAVSGITDALDVGCGSTHSCAARETGEVTCWGGNTDGQLGNGGSAPSFVPTAVSGISDAVAVSVGQFFACALRASGEVACWGRNTRGQLGNGSTTLSRLPVAVTGLRDAVQISAGTEHVCAVRAGGDVVCWGANGSGRLGDGTTVPSAVPVAVPGLVAVEVSAGDRHSCARPRTGGVVCWGSNEYGQLGDGTMEDRSAPTPVDGL